MNRRLLLASITTLAASRTLAQTSTPAPTGMSAARQKHIKDTMTVGSLSLLLSRIAQPKTNNPRLKQFVEFEIAEQETVADVMKAIQTNAAPTGSIPAPTDAELMQNVDDAGKAQIQKLRGLGAGAAFERAYVQYEVEGHRKLLDIQEVYLQTHDDLDETNAAKLARGMIKEHLALLADLEKVG